MIGTTSDRAAMKQHCLVNLSNYVVALLGYSAGKGAHRHRRGKEE
jgi:hypothetical protein